MAILSPGQFEKAIAKAQSITHQNQIMESINGDVVDLIETVLTFKHDLVEPVPFERPKDAEDVAWLVSKASFRLRLILQMIDDGHLTLGGRNG